MPPSTDDPRISVVIPTYNRARLVTRAIESVLQQSPPPLEILVVDDGSTDDTRERLNAFGDAVRYLPRNQGGASAARNYGVDHARGDWIAFLDSDDRWAAGYLARMRAAITATRGAAGFYFSNVGSPPDPARGDLWTQCGFRIEAEWLLIDDASPWVLPPRQPMLLPFSVFHRERYRACGGLWERLSSAEDTHLFLKLGLGGSACAVAGEGGWVMDDDSPGSRLTAMEGSGSVRHWENVLLLSRDLLEGGKVRTVEGKRLLRLRMADAHWRLGRIALGRHAPGNAARHFVSSLAADPRRMVQAAFRGRRHRSHTPPEAP